MLAKDILTLAESIEEEKERKAGAKKEADLKRQDKLESFLKCKKKCICFKPGGKCCAIKLRQCPNCHNVLQSQCSKARCKDESGTKPQMLLPACAQQNTVFCKLVDDGSATTEDDESDFDFEMLSSSTDGEDEEEAMQPGSNVALKQLQDNVKEHTWVKVKYEEEVFLGKVLKNAGCEVRVRCLQKPFGTDLGLPHEMEKDDDAVFYDAVFETDMVPQLVKCGRAWKYLYGQK